MKRLLTYGLLLLTILASHFVVSACQDDLPETTEVMMTFTTRAVMGEASTAPDNERMQDLRVIMLRENGTVVDNHFEEGINASSVTFTFTTPIQTGGEDFTFLAVANEGSIQSTSELSWLSCRPGDKLSEETITQIKAQKIGDGTAFDITDGPIPQTKQWTVTVPQASTHVENQQLDFVASKISVQFLNHTMESQTLSGIRISGIGSAADGYLFEQTNNDLGTQGASSNITFSDVTVSAGEPSDMLSYYTYPVSTISEPTLYATWNDKVYNLPIKISDAFITSLKRNDHLQIVVTLTGEGMMYHIVNWEENPTNIGSPTPEGGYQVDGWGNGNNIIIGGEEPDEPEEPGGGGTGEGEVTVWDKGPLSLGWSNFAIDSDWFIRAPEGDVQMYVYFSDASQFEVRNNEGTKYYDVNLNNNGFGKDPYMDSNTLNNLGGKLSIVIPASKRNDDFYISGSITITKITVMK